MSLEEVSAGRGPGLIFGPSIQALAHDLTNVVAPKQATYHALPWGNAHPNAKDICTLRERKSCLLLPHHQCSVPADTLGNAHHCLPCRYLGIL